MTVRKLDSNKDWVFGGGKSDLFDGDNEIMQNVETRLRSFKNDWFLDTNAEIDWLRILGNRNNKQTIINEVYRVAQATDGVWKVPSLDIQTEDRAATITITILTTNSKQYNKIIEI